MSTPQLIDLSTIDTSALLLLLAKKQELDSNPFSKLADAVKGIMDAKQLQKSKLLSINNTITNNLLSNNSQSSIPDIKPNYAAIALANYDALHSNQGLPDYAQLFASSTDMSSLASQLPMSVLMNLAMLGTPTFDTSTPTLLEYQLNLQVNLMANDLETNADSNYQSYIDAKAKKATKLTNTGNIIGAAGDLVSSFLPEKLEYSGKKGAITAGLDNAYNQLADAASKFGPVGSMVGGLMKANGAITSVFNKLGAGTSGMTVQDAILGSNFMPVIGWANGWGGQTTSTITKDDEAFAQVGSSYGGTENTVDEALEVSGKKYGLLSNSARKKAERQLAEARRLQTLIAGISDEALTRNTLQGTMSDILSNKYRLLLLGGYNQGAVHVGKRGLKVSPYKARMLTSNITFKFLPKEVEGTKIASYVEPTDLNFIITTFKEGGSIIESVKLETIIEPIKIETEIAPVELDLIETFLNGGEINVIPDGALHKNLHHMEDAEHLTKKGIPVVAIDDNELVAEIETSEIIFRKSVTEKLEELYELYYLEDATKELKDEYALEAGLMLVDEILNNTIDNTNKLL